MTITSTTVADYGFSILSDVAQDVAAGADLEDALENRLDTYSKMGAAVAALLSYHAGNSFEADMVGYITLMAADYVAEW